MYILFYYFTNLFYTEDTIDIVSSIYKYILCDNNVNIRVLFEFVHIQCHPTQTQHVNSIFLQYISVPILSSSICCVCICGKDHKRIASRIERRGISFAIVIAKHLIICIVVSWVWMTARADSEFSSMVSIIPSGYLLTSSFVLFFLQSCFEFRNSR